MPKANCQGGNEEEKGALEEKTADHEQHTKLSSKSKAKAKRSAKRAGRTYPNLVDNMNAAKEQRAKKSEKKK